MKLPRTMTLPPLPIGRVEIHRPEFKLEATGDALLQRYRYLDLSAAGASNSPAPTLEHLFTRGAEHFDIDDGSATSILAVIRGGILIEDCTCDSRIRVSIHDGRLEVRNTTIRGIGRVDWAEYVARTNGRTRSVAFSTLSGSTFVSATAGERPDKYEEQAVTANRLAEFLSSTGPVKYRAQAELPGGNDYDDAVLVATDGRTIPLQIRHFHDAIACGMRGPTREIVQFQLDDIPAVLQAAIATKELVDPDVKARTHLVLISPVSLGRIGRFRAALHAFDAGGFARVWCSPFRENPFELNDATGTHTAPTNEKKPPGL